jgi:hypothetical protein
MSQSASLSAASPELRQPDQPRPAADPVLARLIKLAAAGSSGVLPLSGRSEGAIHVREGRVVLASSSRTPDVPDSVLTVLEPIVDAVLDLVVSKSACGRFRSARSSAARSELGPPGPGLPVGALMTELARRRRLLAQMSGSVTPDTVVIRNPSLSVPRVQVSALQWALVIRCRIGITPRDLAFELGRSVFGTTADVHRLMTMRLLCPAAEGGRALDPVATSFIRAVPDEKGD